jgi:hypothetical protein
MYRTFVIGLFTAAVATSAHAQRVDSTPPFDATAPQLLTGDLNDEGKPDVVLYGSAAYFALGAGPQGPAGAAGDVAVSGSVLLVVSGMPAPAGYVYLGSFKQPLPSGAGPATSVTLDVYRKP